MRTICCQQNDFRLFLNSYTSLKILRFGVTFDRTSKVHFGRNVLGSSTQEAFYISLNGVGVVISLKSSWEDGENCKLSGLTLRSCVGCFGFVFMVALFTAFTFIVYSNHSSQKPSPPTLLPPSSKSKPQQAASIVHYSIVSPSSSCKSSPTGLSIMQPIKGIFYWDFHLSHSV